MKGLDNISNRIMAEANAYASAILNDAEGQAKWIVQNAETEAAAELERGRADIEARCADMAEKARLAASLERRRLIAATRRELINSVFDSALKQLIGLPAEKYRALLIKLAEKALDDGEGGELLLNAADREAHGEALLSALRQKLPQAELTLAPDCAAIPGGLVIRRGKIELNCALDVTVRMLTESMALEVGGLLFPEGA